MKKILGVVIIFIVSAFFAYAENPTPTNIYNQDVSGEKSNYDLKVGTKKQVKVTVDFFANGIGRVTSNPPGIDCTQSPCSGLFDSNSTVTLKATPLTNTQTGNHFVGWKGKSAGASYTLHLKNKSVKVEPWFKIERCFGANGSGCDLLGNGGVNKSKVYPATGVDTDSDISVGGILHDICCLENPEGYRCGFGNSNPKTCREEWNKAWRDKWNGHTWTPADGFGPYAINMGDPLFYHGSDIPFRLKAPDGTKLEIGDVQYCQSGKFIEDDVALRDKLVGTCGIPTTTTSTIITSTTTTSTTSTSSTTTTIINNYCEGTRFIDNGDGTVTDPLYGIMWKNSYEPYSDEVDWYHAREWVENLSFAGYSDWRLPAIEEVSSGFNVSFEAGKCVKVEGLPDCLRWNITAGLNGNWTSTPCNAWGWGPGTGFLTFSVSNFICAGAPCMNTEMPYSRVWPVRDLIMFSGEGDE